MLKSMTAYGRSRVVSKIVHFAVELHSVNRKHLEINTFIPKELLRFDAEIKKWIAQAVGRGQITVKISLFFDDYSPVKIIPNLPLAKELYTAYKQIAEGLSLPAPDPQEIFRLLSAEKNLFCYEESPIDEEEYKRALHDAIHSALKQFVEMKEAEGIHLFNDIQERFKRLASLIRIIQGKAPGATEKFRQRLMQRLEEVLGKSVADEEKIIKEIAIYAEKVDISEEVIRFGSHLAQVEELFHLKEPAIGKTLEFILQELNREINTIGSKSSDLDISRAVIEIKSELEKIREQTQNIE